MLVLTCKFITYAVERLFFQDGQRSGSYSARDNVTTLLASTEDKVTVCGFRMVMHNIAVGHQRAAVLYLH